jgi:hypothetical protein
MTPEEADEIKKWLTRKLWYQVRSEYRRRLREQRTYPAGVYSRSQLESELNQLRIGNYTLYEQYPAIKN